MRSPACGNPEVGLQAIRRIEPDMAILHLDEARVTDLPPVQRLREVYRGFGIVETLHGTGYRDRREAVSLEPAEPILPAGSRAAAARDPGGRGRPRLDGRQ